MVKKKAKKGQYKLVRQFDGKGYSIYAASRYKTKQEAKKWAASLRRQGYSARVVSSYGNYYIYFRKK